MTYVETEVTQHGLDKIARYGWTVKDEPGVFMEIDKNALQVDHSYQRDPRATDPKILRMASEWSWVACGTITVAQRDGEFFVMDGQYRTLAARRRCDITKMPCMVFDSHGVKQEAEGFLSVNKNRKPMGATESFKAHVAAGDPIALKANELIGDSGRRVDRGAAPHTFSAVTALMRCLREDEAAMRRVWPLLLEICEGEVLDGHLLQALHYIEKNADEGQSLKTLPWRARLQKTASSELKAAMNRAAGYHGKSGARIWADGILTILNHRMKSNRFTLKTGGMS